MFSKKIWWLERSIELSGNENRFNSVFGEFLKCGSNQKTICTYTIKKRIFQLLKGGPTYGRVENFFYKWPFRGNFMRGINCAHRKILKKFSWVLGLKLITPKFDAIISIIWPPENFFRILQCAQSIPRINLPLKMNL